MRHWDGGVDDGRFHLSSSAQVHRTTYNLRGVGPKCFRWHPSDENLGSVNDHAVASGIERKIKVGLEYEVFNIKWTGGTAQDPKV